ncbi:transcription factor bHLH25-like isoform X2 [Silene latifolia]|uniref:transcription factor bHLH25-like isoform X2 n=1 Tax=Silene latifolia TaxID=37657 RepID=UPI003D775B71
MSSPTSYDDWFAELENMDDDPVLLQEFVGDCLVDYQPENTAGLLEDPELQSYTLSAGSECYSPTAQATVVPQQQQPTEYLSGPSNDDISQKRPRRATTKTTKRPRREPDECHSHIMAERQRRQNLSQRFIALSALIPGLKKMDKTSVLGEAITHMKELKEKMKILEEENARRAADSVVVVKKSNECHSSSTSQSSRTSCLTNDDQLPEIETRFVNKTVVIKIHCQMQTGVLPKIMNHIENLNLLVTTSNCMSFNNTTLDINILSEMEPDFDMRPEEVVANLRSIF